MSGENPSTKVEAFASAKVHVSDGEHARAVWVDLTDNPYKTVQCLKAALLFFAKERKATALTVTTLGAPFKVFCAVTFRPVNKPSSVTGAEEREMGSVTVRYSKADLGDRYPVRKKAGVTLVEATAPNAERMADGTVRVRYVRPAYIEMGVSRSVVTVNTVHIEARGTGSDYSRRIARDPNRVRHDKPDVRVYRAYAESVVRDRKK